MTVLVNLSEADIASAPAAVHEWFAARGHSVVGIVHRGLSQVAQAAQQAVQQTVFSPQQAPAPQQPAHQPLPQQMSFDPAAMFGGPQQPAQPQQRANVGGQQIILPVMNQPNQMNSPALAAGMAPTTLAQAQMGLPGFTEVPSAVPAMAAMPPMMGTPPAAAVAAPMPQVDSLTPAYIQQTVIPQIFAGKGPAAVTAILRDCGVAHITHINDAIVPAFRQAVYHHTGIQL